MTAERPCKKARAIEKRSEQLPEGTLERAQATGLNIRIEKGTRTLKPSISWFENLDIYHDLTHMVLY